MEIIHQDDAQIGVGVELVLKCTDSSETVDIMRKSCVCYDTLSKVS